MQAYRCCLLICVGILSFLAASVWAQGTRVYGNRTMHGTTNFCVSATGNDSYSCTFDPTLQGSTYRNGAEYSFQADVANTGAAQINYGLGAKSLVKVVGTVTTALDTNDIRAGTTVVTTYDSANDVMRVLGLGPATGNVIQASSYGVICDGSTDTTTALQNAVTAAKSSTQGWTLVMSRGTGTCRLTGTITVSEVVGFVLTGNGVTFSWAGNDTSPMFLLQDTRNTVFQDFQVNASTSAQLLNVFQLENGSGSSVTPTSNILRHLYIECTNGGCTNGIRFAQGAGGDANNDFAKIEDVTINNYDNACIKIEHAQSKHHKFRDLACHGNGNAPYGIQTTAGSFDCEGCWMNQHTTADFLIATTTDPINIIGGSSENSARLLEVAGPGSTPMPVTIIGFRWACESLNADGRAITYKQAGPLVLLGNTFEPHTECGALEIYFEPLNAIGGFVSLGNYIASTLTNPYTGYQPNFTAGNIINRNGGAGTTWIDMFFKPNSTTHTTLGSAPFSSAVNGSLLYCSDCTKATPCGSGGTGALAKRLNGAWDCN